MQLAEGESIMTKWDIFWFIGDLGGNASYKDADGKTIEGKTDELLQMLGGEGWELIQADKRIADSAFSEKYAFFFKRPQG
jgi:hypothetical protein